jgi:pantothenate kinase-related protein Tda10
VTSHNIDCLIKKKKEQTCHRLQAKLSYGTQPEDLQDILNKYTQEQKAYSREITRKRKRKKYIA